MENVNPKIVNGVSKRTFTVNTLSGLTLKTYQADQNTPREKKSISTHISATENSMTNVALNSTVWYEKSSGSYEWKKKPHLVLWFTDCCRRQHWLREIDIPQLILVAT